MDTEKDRKYIKDTKGLIMKEIKEEIRKCMVEDMNGKNIEAE